MEYTYTTTPDKIGNILKLNKPKFTKSKVSYFNAAVSFDIETTSYYHNDKKYACMYVWGFDIFDTCIIGRTWAEFEEMIQYISEYYGLSKEKRMIIYVHNLSYEFQWILRRFQWENVFAIETRKVLYALTNSGIEFRCSYLLSGYSAAGLAEVMEKQITGYNIMKLKYDYTLIRHSETELSRDEIEYLAHDVKIVSAYVTKCIKEENGICNIPLTKIGYVRRMCRSRCLYGKNGDLYKKFIHELTLDEQEYMCAKWAFSGGFTHSAAAYTGKPCYNVASFDFTSSYPAVMVSEKFPMKKGELQTQYLYEPQFRKMMHTETAICTVWLENVQPIFKHDFYISKSKCDEISKKNVCANGRVVSADHIMITLTSVDFRIIEQCYSFNLVGYINLYWYESDYLPKPIIDVILDLYRDKTTLKGVKGKETEYLNAKEMLNSIYGMCVTEIIRSIINFQYESRSWKPPTHYFDMTDEQRQELLYRANNNGGRFLFYLWGVFVTCYSRRNLWYGIFECGPDYIYSDTDSVKILNYEKHMDFINRYNRFITMKISACLDYHKISHSRAHPKTIKGKEKMLGVWDFEGEYFAFKTLGAKRYCYFDQDMVLHVTVSGLNKKMTADFLTRDCNLSGKYPDKKKCEFVFARFSDDITVPAECTGKMIHTYIDDEFSMQLTDYQGNTTTVHEYSYVHLENTSYHMTIGKEFKAFLNEIAEKPL